MSQKYINMGMHINKYVLGHYICIRTRVSGSLYLDTPESFKAPFLNCVVNYVLVLWSSNVVTDLTFNDLLVKEVEDWRPMAGDVNSYSDSAVDI